MLETELLKKLQLSSNEEFLNFVRLLPLHEVNDTMQSIIDTRLTKLGLYMEYGCCGTNHYYTISHVNKE